MNIQVLNRSLLTNVGNMLRGKQRPCKTCYFLISSWWMIESKSTPKSCLPACLDGISRILVSSASSALLIKETHNWHCHSVLQPANCEKRSNSRLFVINKIELHWPNPASLGFSYSVHSNTSDLLRLHFKDMHPQDQGYALRIVGLHNLTCQLPAEASGNHDCLITEQKHSYLQVFCNEWMLLDANSIN